MKKLLIFLIIAVAAFLHFSKLDLYVLGLMRYNGYSQNNPKLYPLIKYTPVVGKEPKGIVLTVHGQNLDPAKMDSIGARLNQSGYDIYRVAMTGSRGNYEEALTVTREVWLEDLRRAFQETQRWRANKDLPVYCVGFSMGGLMLVAAQVNQAIQCDKFVLLSPALVPNMPSWLVTMAEKIIPANFKFPTAVPVEYRRHDHFLIHPNKIIFDIAKEMAESSLAVANIPTLVMMDPRDELVSYRGLELLAQTKELNNWKFQTISTDNTELAQPVRHLIVDKTALGQAEWDRMIILMLAHLR